LPDEIVEDDKGINVGPRIGFAYNLDGNGNTVEWWLGPDVSVHRSPDLRVDANRDEEGLPVNPTSALRKWLL
jgi:hypothetical protein